MQLLTGTLLLILTSLVQSRPTFDKIAEVLLGALDDRPTYYHQQPVYVHPAPGPLIQEGSYGHGYDYHYGGGYGYQQGYHNGHQKGGYGSYPPPQHGPVYPPNSYYSSQDFSQHGYNPSPLPTRRTPNYYPHKTEDYYGSEASIGGYKREGY